MPRLRLFANLREIAGTSSVDIPSDTVGGLIDAAEDKFGPDFRRGVETSRIWVNGSSATLDDPVGENDEVVLIPPVSGGAQSATMSSIDILGFAPLGVALVAILANLQNDAIWATALVAIAAVWAVDLQAVFLQRGRNFAPLAVGVTAAGSVMATHVLGGAGYGLTIVVAAVVALGWAVALPEYRDVPTYSPVFLTSLLAGLGASSLLLSRSAFSPDPSAVDVFLVIVIAAVALGAIVERMPSLPLVDPFTVTAIGAILAAVGAAAIWDLDVVGYLLVGLGVSVALVAGRGLSSMMRTGRVALTERPPGALTSLDAVILAAAIYYPLVSLVL